ncbi:MAG TPA: hypothetical protein VGQ73_07625, partial [Gemmatimonadales bacterium]|nr:hypothetical protein [Gemmatimonadales bacterium]
MAIPAIALHGSVARAAALYPLAGGPHPYFVPAHALLLYGAVPLAFVGASLLFLAPGLFLALAWGQGECVERWLLSALAISLVLVSGVAGVATVLAGGPVTGVSFGMLCLTLAAACAVVTGWRIRKAILPWPIPHRTARLVLALSIAVPVALLILLAPKFLWESFNGDGAHAFESSRLLLRHALPFWPEQAGDVAEFPGVNSMLFAFPNAWFLRLFGEVEASVRLPFLLYLPVLCTGILAVAGLGRAPLTRAQVVVVWTSLLAFALAMMFSATYDPYSADIALPAAQDALLMVCFLGWIFALQRAAWAWLALFTMLTYTASPSGLLLIGFTLLAVLLVIRPRPGSTIARAGGLLAVCLIAGALAPPLLRALGLPRPGQEHGPLGILRYFAYLQFTDWKRLALVVIPCGILPVLALFSWRRQDTRARLLTLVTLEYFLFFFFLAHISLHHFVPVMVLPVVVAARVWSAPGTGRWRLAWQIAALGAVVLSLPHSFALADARRQVSRTISEQVGDYASSDPAVLHASTLLHAVFPYDWESSVPDSSYGGSPLAWNHYASHGGITDSTNYFLTRRVVGAPLGMRLLAADSAAALYIRSDSIWRLQRAFRPPTPAGSPVYALP